MAVSDKVTFFSFVKTLGLLLLSFFICVQVVGLIEYQLEKKVWFSKYWVAKRLNESLKHLPSILEKESALVLVVGSSEIEVGFSPKIFNQVAKKYNSPIKAVNLGFRSIDISNTVLIQKIHELAKPYAGRIKAVVIVPSLARMTELSGTSELIKNINRNYGLTLHDSHTLLSLAAQQPLLAIQLAFRKYILSDNAPAFLLANINRYFKTEVQNTKFPNQWSDPRSGDPTAWNADVYGELWSDPTPEQREFFKEFNEPSFVALTSSSYVECCDVENLVFSPKLILDLNAKLRTLKDSFKNIYVAYIPFAPNFKMTEAGNQNTNEFLKQMQNQGDYKLLDFSKTTFKPEDYMEFMHFSAIGKEVFSRELAEKLIQDLSE